MTQVSVLWSTFYYLRRNQQIKTKTHLPLFYFFHQSEENMAVTRTILRLFRYSWTDESWHVQGGGGGREGGRDLGEVDRSLLALHLIWAELGSLSPLPHSHTNLGLVLQPIIYPGKHSKPAQAHWKVLFLAQIPQRSFAKNRPSKKCWWETIKILTWS